MLNSSLCDYSDMYIPVKESITVWNTAAAGAATNNKNKQVISKNCASFTNCTTETNSIEIDNARDTDITKPIHILIE